MPTCLGQDLKARHAGELCSVKRVEITAPVPRKVANQAGIDGPDVAVGLQVDYQKV